MFTPKTNLLAGRRGSRPNTPLSGSRRTPLLSTARTRGGTPVSRTNIVEATGSHVLSTYGSTLPVLVTEVLTLAGSGEVTVRLSENGWAWLVSGRRLVVWRYVGGGKAQCRELSLPPSDLKHRSDLCQVYSLAPGQTPCCLAVSPEGVVRYWPSIVHEGSSVDVSVELGGQECYSLTSMLPVGCVLATTTSTLVLLLHTAQGVTSKHLQTSSNLLGGFGRRVSSLLWGGMGGVQAEAKLSRVLTTSGRDPDTRVALVLTALGLQKWLIEDGDNYKQIYDTDINDLTRECMWNALSKDGAEGKPSWLKIWNLDLSVVDGENIAVLVAAVNTNQNISQETMVRVHYGILTLKIVTDSPPIRAEAFTLLSQTSYINEGEEPVGMKMLTVGYTTYLFHNQTIHPLNLQGEGEFEKICLSSGDAVLGTGLNAECPVLFTTHYGVLTLSASQRDAVVGVEQEAEHQDRNTSTRINDSLNISISAQGLENLTMSESRADQLKAAFLLYCKRATGQSQSLVEELFPTSCPSDLLDSPLDRLVISLSQDLIDDFPASDPRWLESLPASQTSGTGGTMSLMVLRQLEDKQRCHELFVTFLKAVGLWPRLSAASVRGRPMSTVLCLAEHSEKNNAAVTLRTIHNDYANVVDCCMKACLDARDVTASGNLTAQDHFYREISRVDDMLESFVNLLEHSVRAEVSKEFVEKTQAVNTVVITVLQAVLHGRNTAVREFDPSGYAATLEYLPWTAARRNQLTSLVNLTLKHALKAGEEISTRLRLQQQVVELMDIILDSYRSQVASLTGDRQLELTSIYEREREQLILQLVQLRMYDQAASLAEKYMEFGALVRICEETGNQEKLEEYSNTYRQYNFSEFLFSWYVKEGKRSRLLTQTGSNKELGRFISGFSDISWLHDIQTSSWDRAAQTLVGIAEEELDLLERKKTQLSIAKLTALASEDEDHMLEKIDQELMLVASQEQIPSWVVEQFGLEHATMRVLAPREMIEMYIGEENHQASCLEFIKALDLLNFVHLEEEEKEKVRLHIWSQSILRDSWADKDTNNPINSLKDTVFFKVVEYAFQQGWDLNSFLPSPEQILHQVELGELRNQPNFQFLIRTGYEHIQRVQPVQ